jgi:hypothetical protein
VGLVEAGAELRPVAGALQRDRHRVLLTEVAQVDGAMQDRRAGAGQERRDLLPHLLVSRLGPAGVGLLERHEHRADQIVAEIGREHPPGREGRRRRRHDDARDSELARDGNGVERPTAAVGQQRVVSRVEAALGGDASDRERHLHVGQPDDPGRRRRAGETQRRADLLVDGAHGHREIERHRAPKEAPGVDPPENQVRVGHRRLLTASRVADRPRFGAGALRAERQRAARIDPRDRSAPGTHFLDVDHRDPQGPAVDVVLVSGLHEPALDDRALGGRAAHVERDQPVGAEDPREARAARDTRRGARLDRVHGLRARGLERERAAVRLGHQELPREAAATQAAAELAEVAIHDRLHVRVHDGRARALVLAPFLRDAVRSRNRHARHLGGNDPRGSLLVTGIAVREQKDDRHRLDAVGEKLPGGGAHGRLVERHEHLAGRGQPLRDLVGAAARHQRLRAPVEHVVHLQEVAATDLEDIAKPLGRDEARARPLVLEERVDPDRGPVDDEPTVRQLHSGLIDAAKDALEKLARRAEGLGGHHGARGLVERDEVCERAADVDADPESHVTPCREERARGERLGREGRGHPRGRSTALKSSLL